MAIDGIPLTEYAERRKKVLGALKGGVGVVMAGERRDEDSPYRPHAHFEYLTGVVDEPGAVLLLDPTNPVETRRACLFLKPLNPERERWDGYRPMIDKDLRDRTGFDGIFRTDGLARMLTAAARRSRRLTCLHPLASFNQPVSPDLALFKKVAERIPGTVIEDGSNLLARARAVKSRHEIALIQQAIDITAAGFEAMMRSTRPGINEFELQRTMEQAYRARGSRAAAFPTIVGSGLNSTVLHYVANDQPLEAGDLVCVDSGAVFGGYRADITRTVPASGRFTERQKEIYEIVLKAELAAIRAVKPGAAFAAIDAAARKVISNAGYGDYFIHSIGHHVGLETHDVAPDEPLKQGAVITIEPGIYIPQERLGVRIEDDVLVTADGSKNLSARIPKKVKEIEEKMRGERE